MKADGHTGGHRQVPGRESGDCVPVHQLMTSAVTTTPAVPQSRSCPVASWQSSIRWLPGTVGPPSRALGADRGPDPLIDASSPQIAPRRAPAPPNPVNPHLPLKPRTFHCAANRICGRRKRRTRPRTHFTRGNQMTVEMPAVRRVGGLFRVAPLVTMGAVATAGMLMMIPPGAPSLPTPLPPPRRYGPRMSS